MPVEYTLLKDRPIPFPTCPNCGELFWPFLRGMVHRRRLRWFWWGARPYCCLICSECKEIVGYEEP